MNPHEIVKAYFDRNFHVVFWPAIGDLKGPTDKEWPSKRYTLEDYKEDVRVGIITGQEISEGRFLHDVDIDWQDGSRIAIQFIPATNFVYGRTSKQVSHCFFTTPEPIPSVQYKDPTDGTVLIELRGTKENGELGLQSMVPPSIWSKEGKREPLMFRTEMMEPAHVLSIFLVRQTSLGATGMLFGKSFGHNGFGHDARLAWAGFLLRAGVSVEDLILMGEAISIYCNNREIADVRRVVESTAQALETKSKNVKGGPSLIKMFGADRGKKIIGAISKWLGKDSDFIRTKNGEILKDNQENIQRAIGMLGVELSYNSFSEKNLITEGGATNTLTDYDSKHMWLRIDREFRFRPTFSFFETVVDVFVRESKFHPVREYLNGLRWDGEPRINGWLSRYGGAVDDSPEGSDELSYLEAVSSIPLIAAVRRVRHPGCKYDEMLVLESQQGMNKSTALRALCPVDEWFSDDLPLNVDAKEIIERTLGKWIIEASDLVGGRKADRDHLKSMLSRQIDGPARMAFAHMPTERPRQFIIVGTTNTAEYLADPTGARRFWPVRVRNFDIQALITDRDQLWAEAAAREANGESIRLPETLWTVAGKHQEDRSEVDAWEDIIIKIVDELPAEGATEMRRVITDVIWGALGVAVDRRDRIGSRRISEIMQRLGFKRTRLRDVDGVSKVGYVNYSGAGSEEELPPSDDTPPAGTIPF